MPLTVDLIRHVESEMNAAMADPKREPFIGGRQNDVDISSLGEAQAACLGLYAVDEGLQPTRFFSSPAKRALRTHAISSMAMGLSVEPIVDYRLQELDQGAFTNQPRTLYADPQISADMNRLGSDFAPPGGESMNMVLDRAADFFSWLPGQYDTDNSEHVWVHTHAVLINIWIGKLLGWTHEETWKNRVANGSLTRIVRDANTWQVAFINQRTS